MSEIIKSITVLMVIEWGRQAWNNVLLHSTFRRLVCIHFMNKSMDDPFEGEELAKLKTVMDWICAECSAEEYVFCDDTAICTGLIDPSNPNWRKEVRSELLDDDLDVQWLQQGIRSAINQEPCRSLVHN